MRFRRRSDFRGWLLECEVTDAVDLISACKVARDSYVALAERAGAPGTFERSARRLEAMIEQMEKTLDDEIAGIK